jgi:hypothetical protein
MVLEAEMSAVIPNELAKYLSDDKKRDVVEYNSQSARVIERSEAQRIQENIESERLVSLYRLVRATFGPSRKHYGGQKLIDVVTAQNRFGEGREGVKRLLLTLLSIPESGLRAVADAEAFEPTAGDDIGNGARGVSLDLERCMFHLDISAVASQRGPFSAAVTQRMMSAA